MSYIDISVIITVLVTALLGARKGFAWQVVQIASIGGGVVLASSASGRIARLLGYRSPGSYWVVAAVVFVAITLGGYLLAARLKHRIDDWELKSWDRELGAALGALKGLTLCAILLSFLLMPSTGLRQTVLERSLVGRPFAHFLESIRRYLPRDLHKQAHERVHGLIVTVPVGEHWRTVEDE